MKIAEVMRKMRRIIRLKTILIPRGRTCTGGGSVREEGRAAPLSQTGAALRCFHSELKGSREKDADEPDTRKEKSAV